MGFRFGFALFLLALAVGCGDSRFRGSVAISKDQNGILGGQEVEAQDDEGHYVAMIYGEKPSGDPYICTATFISNSAALTAAHCVVENLEVMTLTFGRKPFQDAQGVQLKIRSVRVHPQYKPEARENRQDLALIFFDGGLPKGAKAAPLAPPNFRVAPQGKLIALGYGRTEGVEDSTDFSSELGTLRKVDVPARLTTANRDSFQVNQAEGRGVCYGDSGGPAFIQDADKSIRLYAVASAVDSGGGGTGSDTCRFKSVYMRVDSFRGWIETEGLEKPARL